MKSQIHPKYYDNANVRCACGNEFTTGSTMPEISVEICSNCHPFYTGKGKMLDTRGRLEKFKKRLEKSSSFAPPTPSASEEHSKTSKPKQRKAPVKSKKIKK